MPVNEIVVVQYKIKDVRKLGFQTSPTKKRQTETTIAASSSSARLVKSSIGSSRGSLSKRIPVDDTLYALPDKESTKKHSNLSFTNRVRASNKPPQDEYLAWEKSVRKINFDELLAVKDQEIANFKYNKKLEKDMHKGGVAAKSPSANPIVHSMIGGTSRFRTNPNTSGGIFRAVESEDSCIHDEKWTHPAVNTEDEAVNWAKPHRKSADLSHKAFQEKVMPYIRDDTLVYKMNLLTRRPIVSSRVLLVDSATEKLDEVSVPSQRTTE